MTRFLLQTLYSQLATSSFTNRANVFLLKRKDLLNSKLNGDIVVKIVSVFHSTIIMKGPTVCFHFMMMIKSLEITFLEWENVFPFSYFHYIYLGDYFKMRLLARAVQTRTITLWKLLIFVQIKLLLLQTNFHLKPIF